MSLLSNNLYLANWWAQNWQSTTIRAANTRGSCWYCKIVRWGGGSGLTNLKLKQNPDSTQSLFKWGAWCCLSKPNYIKFTVKDQGALGAEVKVNSDKLNPVQTCQCKYSVQGKKQSLYNSSEFQSEKQTWKAEEMVSKQLLKKLFIPPLFRYPLIKSGATNCLQKSRN